MLAKRTLPRRWSALVCAPLALVITVALRLPSYGRAVLDWDESLYLLIAERWSRGGLPYVDIWDHKPAGLYAAFELALLVFGRSVAAPRLLATLLIAGSAWLIWRLLSAVGVHRANALVCVLLYPAYTLTLGGLAANAEHFFIFANLLGLACLMRAYRTTRRSVGLLLIVGAGLSFGAALQFKYLAAFESAYFTACFAVWARKRRAISNRDLFVALATLGAATLLPTLLAFGYFAMHDATHEFVHANFIANARHAGSPADTAQLLDSTRAWFVATAPLWLASAVLVAFTARRRRNVPSGLLLALFVWLIISLIEIAAAGRFFPHYYLVTLAPLIALATLAVHCVFGRKTSNAFLVATLLASFPAGSIAKNVYLPWFEERGQEETREIAAILKRLVKPGDTLHVVDDQPILYFLTDARPVTRYVFPPHLMTRHFTALAGIGFRRELARIIRSRPRCFVVRKRGRERAREFRANFDLSYELKATTKRADIFCR